MGQKLCQQIIVDLTEPGRTQIPAEIVEHAHIRNRKPIRQMRKATPLLLFFQRSNQRVKTKGARQQNQQMNAPELRGAKAQSAAFTPLRAQRGVNKIIRDLRGEKAQQFRSADWRQLHAKSLPKKTGCVRSKTDSTLFWRKALCLISLRRVS